MVDYQQVSSEELEERRAFIAQHPYLQGYFPLHSFNIGSAYSTALAIHPNSNYVAVGTDNGWIKVFDINEGTQIFSIQKHFKMVKSEFSWGAGTKEGGRVEVLKFDPSGDALRIISTGSGLKGESETYCTNCSDGSASTLKNYYAERRSTRTGLGLSDNKMCIASPDGLYEAESNERGIITLLNTQTRECAFIELFYGGWHAVDELAFCGGDILAIKQACGGLDGEFIENRTGREDGLGPFHRKNSVQNLSLWDMRIGKRIAGFSVDRHVIADVVAPNGWYVLVPKKVIQGEFRNSRIVEYNDGFSALDMGSDNRYITYELEVWCSFEVLSLEQLQFLVKYFTSELTYGPMLTNLKRWFFPRQMSSASEELLQSIPTGAVEAVAKKIIGA